MPLTLVDLLKKLVKNYDNQITKTERKIPKITGLATTATPNALENTLVA